MFQEVTDPELLRVGHRPPRDPVTMEVYAEAGEEEVRAALGALSAAMGGAG